MQKYVFIYSYVYKNLYVYRGVRCDRAIKCCFVHRALWGKYAGKAQTVCSVEQFLKCMLPLNDAIHIHMQICMYTKDRTHSILKILLCVFTSFPQNAGNCTLYFQHTGRYLFFKPKNLFYLLNSIIKWLYLTSGTHTYVQLELESNCMLWKPYKHFV